MLTFKRAWDDGTTGQLLAPVELLAPRSLLTESAGNTYDLCLYAVTSKDPMDIIDDESYALMADQLAALRRTHGAAAIARIDHAIETALGLREAPERVALHGPTDMYIPGMTDKPWYDPSEYEVTRRLAAQLEAEFPAILAEYEHITARDPSAHRPYQTRLNTLGKFGLQDTPDAWMALHLRDNGVWFDEICAACPVTHRISLGYGDVFPDAGGVIFSVLVPHTILTPHHDTTNAMLTVMLPVLVPPGCGLRVGGHAPELVPGKCFIFDDGFLHDAWNNSDQPRVVLLIDIWHPELTAPEIAACRIVERVLVDALDRPAAGTVWRGAAGSEHR